MRSTSLLPLLLLALSLGGCTACDVIFGPFWGPDVVAGTWTEDRDGGLAPAVVVLESGSTEPNPNLLTGENGNDDGNLVVGTWTAGAPRSDEQAAELAGVDLAELTGMPISGTVAGFDIEDDEPNSCGTGTLITVFGERELADVDGDELPEFYRVTLRLVVEDDASEGAGALTVEAGVGGGELVVSETTIELKRDEGAIVRPPCRDTSDDPFGAEDATSSGGGLD